MQSRVVLLLLLGGVLLAQDGGASRLGREVAIERHLQDDEEFQIGIPDLIEFGRKLFTANWTVQEGGGRPLSRLKTIIGRFVGIERNLKRDEQAHMRTPCSDIGRT